MNFIKKYSLIKKLKKGKYPLLNLVRTELGTEIKCTEKEQRSELSNDKPLELINPPQQSKIHK